MTYPCCWWCMVFCHILFPKSSICRSWSIWSICFALFLPIENNQNIVRKNDPMKSCEIPIKSINPHVFPQVLWLTLAGYRMFRYSSKATIIPRSSQRGVPVKIIRGWFPTSGGFPEVTCLGNFFNSRSWNVGLAGLVLNWYSWITKSNIPTIFLELSCNIGIIPLMY
jgi:hypothetical protein